MPSSHLIHRHASQVEVQDHDLAITADAEIGMPGHYGREHLMQNIGLPRLQEGSKGSQVS